MTSDVFRSLIRYHQMWLDLPSTYLPKDLMSDLKKISTLIRLQNMYLI